MTISVTKPSINLREKLNELDQPQGIKGTELLRADTVAEARNLIGAGRKNLIINGDMQVSQRGDYSGDGSTHADYPSSYTLDRWRCYCNAHDGTQTVQHTDVTLPNGTQVKAYKVTANGNASSGFIHPSQAVEGRPDGFYTNKQITLSCWVRTNRAGQYLRTCDSVYCYLDTNNEIPPDGEWHYMTYTQTWRDGTGTCQAQPAFGSGTIVPGDYIEFTQVQLELGSTATEFEHRSYGEELALCQRYFEVIYSDGNGEAIFSFDFNGSQNRIHWFYKVEKRAAPSFGLASGGSFSNSYTSIGSSVSRTQVYHSSPTFLQSSANTIAAYVDAEL